MADDLTEFHERVHHCRVELSDLDAIGREWAARGVQFSGVPAGHALLANPTKYSLRATILEEPPVAFRSKTGMIANELRSCLDGLACQLAIRHSGSEAGTYFPISKSKAIFDDDGRRKMKRLSSADQNTIAQLAPYQGGDDLLFGLHELDRTRKHIRLGAAVGRSTIALGIGGVFKVTGGASGVLSQCEVDGVWIERIEFHDPGVPPIGQPVTVAEGIPWGLPATPTVDICFQEPIELADLSVVLTLSRLADRVAEIVTLFD